ncbi:hypothetical protein [Spirosoma flavum]|uniref:Uncharacterized protein n=1 Tax=Spirosoma flavum TaxID=2048557 RepID=A0ABW6AUQ3_9BACT
METNIERKKISKIALITTGISLGLTLSASLFSYAQTSGGGRQVIETVCRNGSGGIIGYGNNCSNGDGCCSANSCLTA